MHPIQPDDRQIENALHKGKILLARWQAALTNGDITLFPLGKEPGQQGYWTTWQIETEVEVTPVMGTVQQVRYPVPGLTVADFNRLLARFLRLAAWQRADNSRAGFTFHHLAGQGQADIYQVNIHDFFRLMVPQPGMAAWLARRYPAAVYVVLDDALSEPLRPTPSQVRAEHRLAYAFIDQPVYKTIFGYGPGKFAAAIKHFVFRLLPSQEIVVEMLSIMAPRSTKVLEVWGRDPIYETVHLADRLTRGRFRISQQMHDLFDKQMLTLHCQIHQAMLDGVMEQFPDSYKI